LTAAVAEHTPLENRAYTDEELSVVPDSEKYIKMTATDEGKDICSTIKGETYVLRAVRVTKWYF